MQKCQTQSRLHEHIFFILLYKHTPVLSRCHYTHQQRKQNSLKKKTLTKSISTTIALIAKKININTKKTLLYHSLCYLFPHTHTHTHMLVRAIQIRAITLKTRTWKRARVHTHTHRHTYTLTHMETLPWIHTHRRTHCTCTVKMDRWLFEAGGTHTNTLAVQVNVKRKHAGTQ